MKKNSKTFNRYISNVIFLLGMGVLLYPFVSQYLYQQASQVEVFSYKESINQLDPAEKDQRLFLAQAYNDQLLTHDKHSTTLSDPFTAEDHRKGRQAYAHMLEINEQIGTIQIPSISQELPVYAGTSPEVLQKGIGHLEGTSLPVGGSHTHSVLTGHRGLPNARLFTDLDKVKLGDRFYFTNLSDTLAYQVDQIKVILPHEIDYLAIQEKEDWMTLITCTPYMINSHRLLVRGHRIPYDKEQAKELKQIKGRFGLLPMILALLAILLLLFYLLTRKKKHSKDSK